MQATEHASNTSIFISQSHVDRLIAHQDACTAKLQEQISIMISNQERLHQQLLAEPPTQTQLRAIDALRLGAIGFDKNGAKQQSSSPTSRRLSAESVASRNSSPRSRKQSVESAAALTLSQLHDGGKQQRSSTLARKQRVESAASMMSQPNMPDTDVVSEAQKTSEAQQISKAQQNSDVQHTVIFDQVGVEPSERQSQVTYDVWHSQETDELDNEKSPGAEYCLVADGTQSRVSVGSMASDGDEEQISEVWEGGESPGTDGEIRSEDDRTRLVSRLKKMSTRDSLMKDLNKGVGIAPALPRNSFMRNVNSIVVRGETKKAQALASLASFEIKPENPSLLHKLVRSSYFDGGCALMLLANSVFLGVLVEYAAQEVVLDVPLGWAVVDYIFGVWFVIELLLRLAGTGLSYFFDPREKSWNIFDFVIVVTSSAEMVLSAFTSTSGPLKKLAMVRMVRVARVVRIARILRVLRFFRPLRILFKAIFSTLKSCLWAAILFFIILYMFGIIFVQGTTEYRIEVDPGLQAEGIVYYYGSLPRGIFTLFKCSLGGLDWEVAATPLGHVGAIYTALFILMITFMYLAVINVISALFLQGAIDAGYSDREDVIESQLKEKKAFVEKAVQLFQELDEDATGQVTFFDFVTHLQEPHTIGFMNSLEIDVNDAWTLFALLDCDHGGTVSVDEFVEGCLNVKGNAKSIHTAQILRESKWIMDAIFELVNFMDSEFERIQKQLAMLNPTDEHKEQPGKLKRTDWRMVPPPTRTVRTLSV